MNDCTNVETGHTRLAMRRGIPRAEMVDWGLRCFNPLAWMARCGLRLGEGVGSMDGNGGAGAMPASEIPRRYQIFR